MASPVAVITEMESWEHLKNLSKMVGSYLVPLVALLIYTWKQHEKSQDKLEKALTDHILADDKIHDQLFQDSRAQGEEVVSHSEKIRTLFEADVTHRQMFRSVAAEMDELRGQNSTSDEKLNKLIGEHNATHKGIKHNDS